MADCLGLIGDGAFDTDHQQRVAMSIAWHSVLSGVALELGRSVDPQRVYVMVTTAMVGFMAVLALPEPITRDHPPLALASTNHGARLLIRHLVQSLP